MEDIVKKMKDMDPFDFFGIGNFDCKRDMENSDEYTYSIMSKYTQFVRLVLKNFQEGKLDEKGVVERLQIIDEMYKKIESFDARYAYEQGKTEEYLRDRLKKPEDREF